MSDGGGVPPPPDPGKFSFFLSENKNFSWILLEKTPTLRKPEDRIIQTSKVRKFL